MFKYDNDGLLSYTANANNIDIVDKDSLMVLCLPEVGHFNCAFLPINQDLSADQLSDIENFNAYEYCR